MRVTVSGCMCEIVFVIVYMIVCVVVNMCAYEHVSVSVRLWVYV